MSLVFASRLSSTVQLPERVATTDLFHDVARLAESAGARFYLLGGTREVINAAVAKVRKLYPNLVIAGFAHGYLRREGDDAQAIGRRQPVILQETIGGGEHLHGAGDVEELKARES